MRSLLFTGLTLFMANGHFAQTVNGALLDFNNVSTRLNDNGVFFFNPAANIASYQVPVGSGLNTIFAGSFWFGGIDINSQLKFSGQTYEGTSFGPGPLTLNTALPASVPPTETIWMLSRSEIIYHTENYQDGAYIMPQSIATWPAHGNVAEGFSANLAPFIDTDGNGIYEPQMGDYPCIKGDRAVFMILNDKSGSIVNPDAIGIEMHCMFYQFATNDYLNDATFVDLTVFNRSTQSLNDFKTSFFLDGDIGNYADDFLGCDSTLNLGYYYNGDNNDEANGGFPGYSVNPPALGLVLLNNEMSSFGPMDVMTTTPQGMYNQMGGNLPNGTPWTNMAGQNTSYLYSGNPLTLTGDSEAEAANPPGDRRSIMSTDIGTFNPGDTLELRYAIIYARNNISNLDNANEIILLAPEVQSFYESELNFSCLGAIASISELNEDLVEIYPNPHTDQFTVQFDAVQTEVHIEINDLSGRLIRSEEFTSTSKIDLSIDGPSGVYLLSMKTENGILVKRIVKR